MRRIPQPILYLRVAYGGRHAAQAQETDVRRALEELGIDHHPMHVSCDLDVPGSFVGPALASLMEEASLGMVRTLIALDIARLATEHAVLVRVLTALEGAGVQLVTTDCLHHDHETCARLRSEGTRYSAASGSLKLGFTPQEVR